MKTIPVVYPPAAARPVTLRGRPRVLASVLVAAVVWPVLPPPTATAAPATEQEAAEVEEAKRLFYEGSARYSAADYSGAIDRFTRALEIVTRAGAAPKVRGALLLNLAKAHVRAYDVDTDIRHLRAAREIYRRFLHEADHLDYEVAGRAEAERELGALEARIADLERDNDPPQQEASAALAGSPEQDGAPTPEEPMPSGRRTAGLVLIGVGAAVAAASVGPFVYGGAVIPKNTEAEIQKKMSPPDEERRFRDQEKKKQVAWLATGGVMVAAGIGMLVAGAVLVGGKARTKDARRARLRLAPALGPDGGGVLVSARF